MYVKSHGQGYKVKSFGINVNTSSQGMYMWNMKAQPLMVQKLLHILNFSGMKVKGHGQGHKVKNLI